MSKIFVSGDTHGNALGEMRRFNSKNFKRGIGLTKSDYVIIVGDFGFIFSPKQTDEEKYWLKWLDEKPWTTLFIDGNHDNIPKLNLLPQAYMFGNEVGKVNNSVFHMKRGRVYSINGKKLFTFGGAKSIDANRRTEGLDWWASEEPNYREMKDGLQALKDNNWKVDYVLTHECPSYVRDFLISHHREDNYQLIRYFDEIFHKIDFKHHYFGHHHVDKTIADKHICVYHKIHKLT